METSSQIKKLDTLLQLFKDEQEAISWHFIKEMMEGKGIKASDLEIERYVNQLKADDFIMQNGDGLFLIKIKGLLFDGYEKDILNRSLENSRLANLEIAQTLSRNQMNFLTGIIAIGTLIAAVYYSIEIYKELHSFCHVHGKYWIWETTTS
ncbi:hypothetical protein [Mucilaginibacter sp. SG564]|uniref:hypothetical protein n=1 Tax=Mucilaginibacter sp. SG564 TaxID=2587022 RepID=UPI00155622E8|nr:hypothetical protein [Mucilaginibacter sp. SG564]NOW97986.1 hypothetical protein [Mucilaginibacter sp. SG564]